MDDLTLIITTSPTPSAPSTELLTSILASFRTHCPALLNCPVITVFDTYSLIAPTPRLKRGHVTSQMAEDYDVYRRNATKLILETWEHLPPQAPTPAASLSPIGSSSASPSPSPSASPVPRVSKETATHAEYGAPGKGLSVPIAVSRSVDKRVIFLTPATTLGFGLAVRSALREVRTKYVWVQQHDWALERDVPLRELLGVMRASEEGAEDKNSGGNDVPPKIRYVSFPSVRMQRYARSSNAEQHAEMRSATRRWKGDFEPPDADSCEAPEENVQSHMKPKLTIPLTPVFFWYDKPHIALKDHYMSLIFPDDQLAISRGDFIEDTIGCAAREEMKAGGWKRWATWLYYPDEGETVVLRHLQGRTFRGREEELRAGEVWRASGGLKKVKKRDTKAGTGSDEAAVEDADREDTKTAQP